MYKSNSFADFGYNNIIKILQIWKMYDFYLLIYEYYDLYNSLIKLNDYYISYYIFNKCISGYIDIRFLIQLSFWYRHFI
jgi:hypothetical protein